MTSRACKANIQGRSMWGAVWIWEESERMQVETGKVKGWTCHNDKPDLESRIGRSECGRICEVL